jgi:hypothetical protein
VDEKVIAGWLDGFTKTAAEAGITDPEEVNHLLKVCGRLAVRAKNAEAFDAGIAQAMGMEKTAIEPITAALIMGGLLAGYGGYKGVRGIRNWWTGKTKPWQRAGELTQEAQNLALPQMAAQRSYGNQIEGFNRQLGGGYGNYGPGWAMPRTWYPSPSAVMPAGGR